MACVRALRLQSLHRVALRMSTSLTRLNSVSLSSSGAQETGNILSGEVHVCVNQVLSRFVSEHYTCRLEGLGLPVQAEGRRDPPLPISRS